MPWTQTGNIKGAPKRIETYTATSNASSVATVTFNPAFAAPPVVFIRPSWAGQQQVTGGITATTATGCTVAVKRSRATLLPTSGPFEDAPNTPVTVIAMGN